MAWWVTGAIANLVVAAAYLAISYAIARGLTVSGQWRLNPLGAATAAIFLTCAVHHASHSLHMLLPYVGIDESGGLAMREAFSDWHGGSIWDVITAAVGVYYWTLRGRFPALVKGPAMFEDLKARQRQALEINDNIVQGLTTAKYSFEAGDPERGMKAIDVALGSSRAIISE